MHKSVLIAFAFLSVLSSTAGAELLEHENWETRTIPEVWKPSYSNSDEVPVTVPVSNHGVMSCSGDRALYLGLTYREDRTGFRNELAYIGPNKDFNFGQEYWVGWAIFLPNDYGVDIYPETLLQFHGVPDRDSSGNRLEPSRNPPVALQTHDDGNWQLKVKGNTRRISTSVQDTTRVATYDLGSFAADRGRWTEFVMRVRFQYDGSGVLDLWKNGQQVVSDRGENSFNDDVPPYLKLGIYKPGWKPNGWGGQSLVDSRNIYYDAVRVARNASFADVAPRCSTTDRMPNPPFIVSVP